MDDKLIHLEKSHFAGEWVSRPKVYAERVAEIKAFDIAEAEEAERDLVREISALKARKARVERDIQGEVERRKAAVATRINALVTRQPIIPGNMTMKQKLERLKKELERDGEGVVKAHIDRIDRAIKRASERALKNVR